MSINTEVDTLMVCFAQIRGNVGCKRHGHHSKLYFLQIYIL